MATISLCLIARDEQVMLGGCLASARGAADELIVVDTGSTDRTADVAREHGAVVVEHAWADDFAAARNAALAAATGDWVLVLDADERLTSPWTVRDAVRTDAFDCGLLPLHSAASADAAPDDVVSGAARRAEPVLLPRLFRRTPDLRWHGVIHEHTEAWLSAPGRRVARVEAAIAHYGGLAEIVAERGKVDRNIRLLERRIAADPADAAAHVYLCLEHRKIGRLDTARLAADRAWALLLDRPDRDDGGLRVSLVHAATQRALLQLVGHDWSGARDTVHTAIARGQRASVHPNLRYLDGVAHENMAVRCAPEARGELLMVAAEAYIAAANCDGQVYTEQILPGATSWAAATRLGTVLLQLGRADLALDAFDLATDRQPADPEPRLGRAEALLDLGRADEALGSLAPLLKEGGADAWLLAAAAAEALGAETDRAVFLGRARETARETLRGLHRLERLNRMLAA